MKLTIGLKLKPTPEQAAQLQATLERANQAANECSRIAWDAKVFGQFHLHKISYGIIRERFGLSAQLAVRIIAKVADAYKLDKKVQRTFHKHGSIAFDDRILTYRTDSVSLWTLNGRQKMSFVCGEREKILLANRQGESDLVFRKGKWFLFATVNVIESPMNEPNGFLGVDLGIARLATDNDGQSFSGAHPKSLRKRHRRLRAKLQSIGTKSSKRLLKKRNLKESRFAKDINHQISKAIVRKAKDTKRGVAVEELKGINARTTVRKANRAERLSWSFFDLRAKIEYKAALAGVEVVAVDPHNTSRECSQCGHISQSNRRSQKVFQCRQCGFRINADINAARNISSRATVNRPNAGSRTHSQAPTIAAILGGLVVGS